MNNDNKTKDVADVSSRISSIDPATGEDTEVLKQQLGRVPRGVVGIGARCQCGKPLVVVTAPRLEDGTPFPTTFYLTSPQLVYACSVLEAEHLMEHLQDWVVTNGEVYAAYQQAHRDYLERREEIGQALEVVVPEIAGVSAGGMPERVKCLHALVGHALGAGAGHNPVGDRVLAIIEERGLWSSQTCHCH